MAKKKFKTLLLFSIIIQSTLSFSSLIVIFLLSWLSEMGVVSHSPVTIALIVFSMTEDERQRIFDKFYQADRSHGASGNGLGLAITKQVLTLCDAEIFVSSHINEGSCFTVVLPIE